MPADQSQPGNALTARDLMRSAFERITIESSLDEARQALVALQSEAASPNALVVVDGEGKYAGILTARRYLKSLRAQWSPGVQVRDRTERWQRQLLVAARKHGSQRVGDLLTSFQPVARPGYRLAELIAIGGDERMEVVPVVEDGRPVGLIPLPAIVIAAASRALRPDDGGIRIGDQTVK